MFTAPKWLQFLGDASYTIYLTHFALLSAYTKIIVALGIMQFLNPQISFVLLAVSTCMTAYFLYLVVERRLLFWLRQRWGCSGPYVASPTTPIVRVSTE